MDNSDGNFWAAAERIAQIVTVAAAVLVGISTILGGPGAALSNVFITITVVGGMSMGVLYFRRRLVARGS